MSKLEDLQLGPVLFREEAIFKREIVLEDTIVMDVALVKSTPNFRRWNLRHTLFKENIVAAIINIECGWINTTKRKLAVPNAFIQNIFNSFPRAPDFEWILKGKIALTSA